MNVKVERRKDNESGIGLQFSYMKRYCFEHEKMIDSMMILN